MTEAWDIFWLTAAWVGLGFAVVVAFLLLVWLLSKLVGDEPEPVRLPETPMWTYERGPNA